MRWAHFLFLVLATTYAKDEDTNEVKPPINLDANLRRALLKALTELENEDNEKRQTPLAQIETKEQIVEKASASALSFFASTDSSLTTENIFTSTPESTQKPIVVVQKSFGLQHKPITTLEKYKNDEIQTSASNSFTSSKLTTKTEKPNLNSVSNNFKSTTKLFKIPKIETTTPTTTTTTEESQAKVEDVQFFSAPLVAAFTVHQDERGLPKSVEPIYRTKPEQKPKETITTQPPFIHHQQEQIRQQFVLHEKQRVLEAEIQRLRQQQQQQNYLIRQQQILHQQQLELQKQKILDEQSRLFQNRQPFLPTVSTNFQPTTQRTDFSSQNRGNLVSFQPSISFTSHQHPSGILPLNAQQLPVKGATDFRSSFNPSNNLQQFNYLSHQQPPLENTVSHFNVLSTAEPQLTLTAPKQHHRVFRQESNTGNFFNNFNNFNQFNPSHQNHNRFFRSNVETIRSTPLNFQAQPPVVNQQLNHLLYSSGFIRDKQHEDLNIVSKVLALNHYGGDYRFDGSSIREQRVPAPAVIKKV